MTVEEHAAFYHGQLNASNKMKNILNHYKLAAQRLQKKATQPDTIDRNLYLYDILVAIEAEIDAFNFTDPKD